MAESAYNAAVRRDLAAAPGRPHDLRARAEQTVDIACHAADRAWEVLIEAIRSAPDALMMRVAAELALQLAAARMNARLEALLALGRAAGARTTETMVEVPQ